MHITYTLVLGYIIYKSTGYVCFKVYVILGLKNNTTYLNFLTLNQS